MCGAVVTTPPRPRRLYAFIIWKGTIFCTSLTNQFAVGSKHLCVCVCELWTEFLHVIKVNSVCHKASTESPCRLKYKTTNLFSRIYALFQASAFETFRTAFFWVITQRVVVISYRRFGTTYRSYLHWSRIQKKGCCPNTEFI